MCANSVRTFIVGLWATGLLCCLPLFAQAPNNDAAVHPGHSLCSRLTATPSSAVLDFISGYGTARYAQSSRRGVAETDPFFGQPRQAVLKWLADWCADNPRRSLADAASHFYDQLAGAGPVAAAFSAARAPAAPPSSCSAPTVGACAGCSVSCAAPQQAQCSVGRELSRGAPFGARCGAASQCECR
jgi:hypothetical protein